MIKVTGVRFRQAGKVYYFDPKNLKLERGSHVIVETARGIEYGTVIVPPKDITDDEVVQPLKAVIRVATPEDDRIEEKNHEKEKDAYKICLEKIEKHGLAMKLVQAEYTFDNNKLLFYFTADGRIDFRELVKDLASVFRTRIELRQIGVRDETKILGGIGICGRPLCCHTFLTEFAPVSIKMAKEQNLSLNPTKISGVCGRLMCCLKNEEDTYEYLNSRLPDVGETVTLPDGGKGEVHSVNVLRQTVKVLVEVDDGKEMSEYPVAELKFRPRKRKNTKEKPIKEAVKETAEGEQETGAPKESREPKESKEPKEPKERKGGRGRDGEREPRERKGNREGERESRERRNNRHGSRRDRDGREAREGKGSRESREVKAADTTEKES